MEEGNSKKIIIVAIAVVALIVILFLVFGKGSSLTYTKTKAGKDTEDMLFSNKADIEKFVSSNAVEDSLKTNNHKNDKISTRYTDEYFQKNKLAVITLYEDDSKEYIAEIEDIVYNSGKTKATINYTYKSGVYLGTLGKTWYETLFVELEPSVEDFNFVNVGQ